MTEILYIVLNVVVEQSYLNVLGIQAKHIAIPNEKHLKLGTLAHQRKEVLTNEKVVADYN